jgi:uncharacterized membrane protein YqjE
MSVASDPATDPPRRGHSGDDPASSAAGAPRLRDALGSAATTVASALHTRLELAAVEFSEERERAKRRLALVLLVAIAGAFSLLAANVLFVLALWDRLGLYSLALVLILYLAVASAGAWRLATIRRRERRPFDTTLSELERDRAWLAAQLGDRR